MGSDRVTLMTPEPDLGFYGVKGVEAFVRRYGYDAGDDTMYFTGAHRANQRHEKSHMLLTVKGFDPAKSKITDVDGGIFLVDTKEEVAAGWSFRALIAHWARKHAAAAYVPYEVRETDSIQYRYVSPASLGEGTQFSKFLAAMITGNVIYDPAPKVMNASSGNPTVKARSQFRTRFRTVNLLYERFADEAIG